MPAGPYDLEVMAADALRRARRPRGRDRPRDGGLDGRDPRPDHRRPLPRPGPSLILACTGCRHLPWRRELLAEWGRPPQATAWGPRPATRAGSWARGPGSGCGRWSVCSVRWPSRSHPRGLLRPSTPSSTSTTSCASSCRPSRRPPSCLVGSQDILTPIGDSQSCSTSSSPVRSWSSSVAPPTRLHGRERRPLQPGRPRPPRCPQRRRVRRPPRPGRLTPSPF